MAKFEDAIIWVMNGSRARRKVWAKMPAFTLETPPIFYEKVWRIWQGEEGQIMQGWGGQTGAQLDESDPIRDGTYYRATDFDRTADDWELFEGRMK